MQGGRERRLRVEAAVVREGGGEQLDAGVQGGDAARLVELERRDGVGGGEAALGDPGLDAREGEEGVLGGEAG